MFAERRRRFLDSIEEGVALVFAAPEKIRSHDTNYRFRQDTYFSYLTGFPEPDAIALFAPGRAGEEFVLFVRPRNRERETWDGRRFGPEGALEKFGADKAYTLDQFEEIALQFLENTPRLYHRLGAYADRDALVLKLLETARKKIRQGITAPTAVEDPAGILDEMRLHKTPAELDLMRKAAVISSEAHREAMRALEPGLHEYEIEAVIEYVFRKGGASGPAYNTIAGSGVNATILHYTENTDVCRDGDMLLVDAGAEFQGYAADITRTFPVSGRFTDAQRRVYDIVLEAQLKAIEKVRPGTPYDEIHQTALRVLVEGLVRLGILKGNVNALIEGEAYKPYYMHKTGHWLGMDVHDAGSYRRGAAWRPLEPGMVLTVEPGLYFAEDLTEVPKEYRGLGIRIEDDVLVTAAGHEVLTKTAPKTVDEIESVMAGGAPALIG